MDYRNWYCVQVAANCEKKAKADLLARRTHLEDRFIQNVEVPEATELTFDKAGKRKAVKKVILPGYILVQVLSEVVEDEEGNEVKVFPAFTQKTIRDTFNVIGFAGANKNKPRRMSPKEMRNIFSRVDSTHQEVKQNVQVDYNVGDILDVTAGPFAGNKVEVTSVQGMKILGQLTLFGRIVPAEFTVDQLYKETTNA
jgi:transcriptional antiterminator NusG